MENTATMIAAALVTTPTLEEIPSVPQPANSTRDRGARRSGFGVTMAAAILIDATIVRGVLLPAGLSLLGDRAWGGRPE
jgi:hypothetical protein